MTQFVNYLIKQQHQKKCISEMIAHKDSWFVDKRFLWCCSSIMRAITQIWDLETRSNPDICFVSLESHSGQVSVRCLELRNLTCLYFYFVRHPFLLLLFGASKISKLSLMLICICWHFLHLRKHDFLPNDLIEMTIILPNHYSRINIHPLPILVQEDDYIVVVLCWDKYGPIWILISSVRQTLSLPYPLFITKLVQTTNLECHKQKYSYTSERLVQE